MRMRSAFSRLASGAVAFLLLVSPAGAQARGQGGVIALNPLVTAEQPAAGQSAAGPSFDVVSVKPTQPGTRGTSWGLRPGGRWAMTNRSIGTLIREAYPSPVNELANAPEWVTTDPYDVDGRAGGEVTRDEIRQMLRALLEERFQLSAHYETREVPVYALVVAADDGRPGDGLVRSSIDCDAVNAARLAGWPPEGPGPANGAPACGWTGTWETKGPEIHAGGIPLSRLSEMLGQPDGRVIVDRTGLEGFFEFTLRYTDQPAVTDDVPSLFTALDEQLGLKLVPDRAPLPVLVVDHIDRPTEN